jgi:ATP-binding protein involved in chromosome partitioning
MWPFAREKKPASFSLDETALHYVEQNGCVLEKITTRDDSVTIVVRLGPQVSGFNELGLVKALTPHASGRDIRVLVTGERPRPMAASPSRPVQTPSPPLDLSAIKQVIAVASGKGGVGKSTVAVNLAVTMARSGLKTGLLDADIYGPSVPMMMGLRGVRAETGPDKKITPLMAHGVKCMSMGMLVDSDAPMIWRGPMVQSAIVQMLRDVDWAGDKGLDILIIDMPPGTGDAQLALAQKVQLSGAIIVTTPQDVAMLDAQKGLQMFQKTGVKILGIVENMSVFCCPNCGSESAIFGAGAARDLAAQEDVPFLGALPIDIRIREHGDAGTPKPGESYQNICTQILGAIPV